MAFSLHQFDTVFDVLNPAGLPYLLIGGQAVNFWAEKFIALEPSLSQWLPFTSEDIDFHGGRDDVTWIANQLGAIAKYPHKVEMTALAGIIPFRIGDIAASIEIVRRVPGVRNDKLEEWGITAEREGRHIRILDPISLLCCKSKLALTVSQKDRRDIDHLRIMILCVRAFLRETLRGAETGDLPIKGWLGAAERVLTLAESTDGRKAARRFGIHWPDALPLSEINQSEHKKLIQFRDKRLPPWLTKVTRYPGALIQLNTDH